MIEIKNISKSYQMGDVTVTALKGVSLRIAKGEFVAIMRPTGSGKSTMMNILGLLDTPDSGSYRLNGLEIARMSEDELAMLRQRTIGFIFQQFNLLPRSSALENVALPHLYTGATEGLARPEKLLGDVGLGTRLHHKPNELSGGQQQRVAIARALVNNPAILFADEPTGNLDSKSEKEIMGILTELNNRGITIILVSHEPEIVQYAKRVIKMRDGEIQSDELTEYGKRLQQQHLHQQPRTGPTPLPDTNTDARCPMPATGTDTDTHTVPDTATGTETVFLPARPFSLNELQAHVKQGLRSLAANKVRAGLSMLGILIGVAAVIAMLALGRGAQESIEQQLAALGTNLLVLKAGSAKKNGVSTDAAVRFTIEDAQEMKNTISSVKRIAPQVTGRLPVVFNNANWTTQIMGTTAEYAAMHASEPVSGRFFKDTEDKLRSRVAVIGQTVARQLFGSQNPVGQVIRINKVIFQVIGVLPEKGASGWKDPDDVIMVPLYTAMYRLLGKTFVDSMDIEISDPGEIDSASDAIKDTLVKRHHFTSQQLQQQQFQIRNMAELQETLSETSNTMSLLLASIAAISLLVGGIGIMNIMLVSVTERTREIGLRKAVGARRRDILSQFLVEAVVVSLSGGMLGILTGFGVTQAMNQIAGWNTSMSADAIVLSFAFSAGIGILFGIWPAKKASLLSPIEALRHD